MPLLSNHPPRDARILLAQAFKAGSQGIFGFSTNKSYTRQDSPILSRLSMEYRNLYDTYIPAFEKEVFTSKSVRSALILRTRLKKLQNDVSARFLERIPISFSGAVRNLPQFQRVFSLNQLFKLIDSILTEYISYAEWRTEGLNADAVREIIPEQTPSPAYFVVSDNKFFLDEAHKDKSIIGSEILSAAKHHLLISSSELLERLKMTNCDPKLIEKIRFISDKIQSDGNVVGIGLDNFMISQTLDIAKEEIGDFDYAQILSHTKQIDMYLAQFSEWREFINNANTINFTAELELAVKVTIDKILSEQNNLSINDKVREYFEFIRRQSVSKSSKYLVASYNSVINFLIAGAREALNLLVDSTKEARKTIVKTGGNIIYASFIYLCISAAEPLMGIKIKPNDLTWIENVVSVLRRELASISQNQTTR